jgi:hypothetical protein
VGGVNTWYNWDVGFRVLTEECETGSGGFVENVRKRYGGNRRE